jgi:hypothetical protein
MVLIWLKIENNLLFIKNNLLFIKNDALFLVLNLVGCVRSTEDEMGEFISVVL